MSFKSSFTIPAVTAISLCFIGGKTPAYADLGDQVAKLLPDNGAAFDKFGHSVAISGPTVIVGAWGNDENGERSGSTYLFDTTTGLQIAKLLPDDSAEQDEFGVSVAISGATGKEIAIVGARADDDNGDNSGSAYLFDVSDPANPTQIAKLLANDGAKSDGFGISVAISGTTAIVGAWFDRDNGHDSGSAYLFDTTTGRQIAKLLPNDGAADDRFGFSVAISGPTAIVGAWGNDENGERSGSVYLFDISDPNNPAQIARLLADDGAAGGIFGYSVGISGPPGKEVAIVGAYGDDDNGDLSGSAYLFDAAGPRKVPVGSRRLRIRRHK
ncbi:MAG: FG-GAP repeat protein [Planctomycetes bacterium]|nr:FG-GAP repeat protein [Planctomycetota bacterium]